MDEGPHGLWVIVVTFALALVLAVLPLPQWLPGISPALDATLNTLLLVFPASLVLSVVFFNAVERPFMRLRTRYVSDDG